MSLLAKADNYKELLSDLRSLLTKAKCHAYQAVDNIRVQTYWQIGERIVREELLNKNKAGYGEKLIRDLAKDLGFSKVLLHYMVRFYRVYPIVQTVSERLSWSHLVELMFINNRDEREFYTQQSIQNSWSVRTLRRQTHKNLYHQAFKKGKVVITKKFPLKTLEPEQVFKDVYCFNFLGSTENLDERGLKEALLDKLEEFLQELGPDFFIGRREARLLIGGNYDKIDLELFHAGLLCYILVEIKMEQFKHQHVSQMYSYLNWYKQNKQQKGQRPPIGLIICKTKDEETVHYALGDLKKEIFIAEYSTKLPSKEKIRELIK